MSEEKKQEKKSIGQGELVYDDPKHGKYYKNVPVKCICGAVFYVNATVPGPIEVEVCHNCHPVYTGKKKEVKAIGRVERFMKRMEKSKQLQEKLGKKK